MNSQATPDNNIVIYETEDGRTRVQCRFDDESIWLTQAQMADLFQTSPQNITLHLKAIYEGAEADEKATCKEYLQVRSEGGREVTRNLRHYNLPAILAVGYRVRSERGTQFRQWVTARLTEYLVKGFTIDDERLKNPPGPDVPDYFDELLERIRDIRASERRMYLRIKDILALASDYQASGDETALVFKTVQNKLHYAATGKTAAELIYERADAEQPNMNLTTWKSGVVRKGDVTVAKNYLHEPEIDELNRIVTMFLDFAEDQARRKQEIFLRDWQTRLDDFLQFNDREVLQNAGKISRQVADDKAQQEYENFAARRRDHAETEGLKELEKLANTAEKKLRKKPS